MRDETKVALERSASAKGRSISEEVEALIEQGMQARGLLDQALDLAFGRRAAGLVLTVLQVIDDIGSHAGFASVRTLEGAKDWLNNPYAYDQVVEGVVLVLESMRPEGPAEIGRRMGKFFGLDLDGVFEHLGQHFASGILEALSNPERGGGIGDWAKPVRERLGAELSERIRTRLISHSAVRV